MPKKNFDLYFASAYLDTLHSLRKSLPKRGYELEIELQPLKPNSKIFEAELKVIADELCEKPKLRLSLASSDLGLFDASCKLYISLLEQGYRCCLYDPESKAIVPNFDYGLRSIKVAHLMYKAENSDKVYHLYLNLDPANSNYSTLGRYGRRGGSLREFKRDFGQNLDLASQAWEETYKSKLKEGYKIGREYAFQQLKLI